jgi:hypothetical protein
VYTHSEGKVGRKKYFTVMFGLCSARSISGETSFKPLYYEGVIFRGVHPVGVKHVRANFFTVIFVFSIVNLSGNDFQTITL